MGKSKPRVRNRNRADPKAKPIKPPTDPELAALRETRILPVVNDLQSPDLKTRSAAAKAITSIIENSKCRKLLLREQIVRILLEQTLTDSDLEARAAGWDILRNLAQEEEADFCIHLYRQDVLTAIEGIVRMIMETVTAEEIPITKLPKAQQELVWNLSSSVINLLTSLSEAQDEIVGAISQLPVIIRFLFGLLAFEHTPEVVLGEALTSLVVLIEDNKLLCQQIVENTEGEGWFNRLIQIKDSHGFNAVAACGVLHNLFAALQWFDHNTPKEGASDAMLMPTLVESMKQASGQTNKSNGHGAHSSPDEILQLALDITASIATSLQEALEHGSKFEKEFEGFGDSQADKNEDDVMDEDLIDGDEDEDEGDEDDDEMNDDEIQADMDLVLGEDEIDDGPPQEVTLDRLIRDVAPAVLSLARPSQAPTPEAATVQSHALATISNIAWTVSSIDFSTGHLKSLQKFWSSLGQSIWHELISPVLASNTADIELASAVTSLAWAICRSLSGTIVMNPEEPRKFMALYQASKSIPEAQAGEAEDSDAFQGLGVKSIGVLGRIALDPAPVALNREIGVFLITTLAAIPDTRIADSVEALNQLFDIYADKSFACDEVFWADGFYGHLEEILPKMSKMTKKVDKRKFGELRSRADEAVLNLGRFLRYKKKEKIQKDKA